MVGGRGGVTTTQEVWCDIEWYAGGYAGTNGLLGGSAHFYTCMQCEATPILMHHNCVSMEMHELMHPKSRSRILHLQANWGYQLSSNSNHLAQSYSAAESLHLSEVVLKTSFLRQKLF